MTLRSPLTVQPYDYISDSTGRPLDKGQIYIGVAGQDPEFYQIPVYLDAAMTKPIDQPIRTNDGFVDFAGSLSELYASAEVYSVKVLDKQGRKVLYKGDMTRKNLMSDALADLNQSIIDTQTAAQITLNAAVNSANTEVAQTVSLATAAIDTATTKSNKAATDADAAIKTLFENGGLPATPFKTKALMTASALVDGDYAMVTDDAVNNGLYVKEAGVWVKSEYDPLEQAKAYTDDAQTTWAGKLSGWDDVFFRHSVLGFNANPEKRTWYADLSAYELVDNQIFNGKALRVSYFSPTTYGGPRVHLSDIEAAAGDTVTVRMLATGTGNSVILILNQLDAAGANVAVEQSDYQVVSSIPQLITLEITIKPGVESFYIRPRSQNVGEVFDIVAFWACKGVASKTPKWPIFFDDQYAVRLATANGEEIEGVKDIQASQGDAIQVLEDEAEGLSPLLAKTQEDFNLILSAGYLHNNNGKFFDTNSYRSSQHLPCSPSDEIYVTIALRSVLMAGVCYYNSEGEFISFELEGSGTKILYSDHKLTIPTDAAFFALSTTREDPPTAYKMVYELDVFTRQQSDSRYVAKDGASSQFYGIRWDISSSASACERTGAAVGLTSQTVIGDGAAAGSNDFDAIYPWSDIRRCAIRVLPSGAPKLLYEGEDGYAEDGSAGDVFYEIPRFGYERKIVDGYEYRTIARDGLEPHPAFVEPGVVLEKIYVSAYNAAEEEGVLQSLPSTLPTMNQTAQELLDKATVKGRGFTLLDMRTLDALQNLLWIEHATRNSTSIIGHGFAELKQARDDTWPIAETMLETNVLVLLTSMSANNKEQMFTGQDFIICGADQYDIRARRKIVSVSFDDPSTGYATMTFSGDPLDVTAGWFAGSCPQTTGQTDAMEYHTGRLDRPKFEPTSTIPRNEMNANRYRGMENLVGDVWRLLPDVTYSDGNMYVCRDITAYQFHSIETPYYPVALDVPLQVVNDDGSWVQSLEFDNISPSIAVAKSFGAANSGNYFGAFHYLSPNLVCIAHGGGFDHKKRCNLLTYRAWIAPDSIWYLYGGRLLFKPI